MRIFIASLLLCVHLSSATLLSPWEFLDDFEETECRACVSSGRVYSIPEVPEGQPRANADCTTDFDHKRLDVFRSCSFNFCSSAFWLPGTTESLWGQCSPTWQVFDRMLTFRENLLIFLDANTPSSAFLDEHDDLRFSDETEQITKYSNPRNKRSIDEGSPLGLNKGNLIGQMNSTMFETMELEGEEVLVELRKDAILLGRVLNSSTLSLSDSHVGPQPPNDHNKDITITTKEEHPESWTLAENVAAFESKLGHDIISFIEDKIPEDVKMGFEKVGGTGLNILKKTGAFLSDLSSDVLKKSQPFVKTGWTAAKNAEGFVEDNALNVLKYTEDVGKKVFDELKKDTNEVIRVGENMAFNVEKKLGLVTTLDHHEVIFSKPFVHLLSLMALG